MLFPSAAETKLSRPRTDSSAISGWRCSRGLPFFVFGDRRALAGCAKESILFRFFCAGDLFFEFTGFFVSAGYREESGLTQITLRGDSPLEEE